MKKVSADETSSKTEHVSSPVMSHRLLGRVFLYTHTLTQTVYNANQQTKTEVCLLRRHHLVDMISNVGAFSLYTTCLYFK